MLRSAKETENKLRWDTIDGKVKFSLYIPKWRVPNPYPEKIFVEVSDQTDRFKTYIPLKRKNPDPNLLKRPILALLTETKEQTQTVRFAPSGEQNDWEIGEPYIPFALLPEDYATKPILIEVKWGIKYYN